MDLQDHPVRSNSVKRSTFLKPLPINTALLKQQLTSKIISIRTPVIDSFYYFGSSVIALFLSVITTPIFSKHFSHEDFAVFNYFNNFAGFFSFFLSFELMSFYGARYFKNEAEKNKELIGSIILFLLALNVVFILIIWQVATYTFSKIGLKFPSRPFLLLALLTVGSNVFKNFWLFQFRLRGESLKYFLIAASSKVLTILVGLGLVIYLSTTNAAKARMTGIMMVELTFAIVAIIYFFRQGYLRVNFKMIRQGIRFCLPVLMGSVIYYLIISSDQFFLERRAGVKEIALYSLGVNFASYVYFFNYSVFQALEPQIMQHTIKGNYKKLNKTIAALMLVAIFSTVSFTLVSKYMISFLTKDKFTEAYQFANILAYSNLFVIAFSVVSTILVSMQKTKTLFVVNGIGGIVSLSLFYISSNNGGGKAVAYSKVGIFVFVSSIGFLVIKRLLDRSSNRSLPSLN